LVGISQDKTRCLTCPYGRGKFIEVYVTTLGLPSRSLQGKRRQILYLLYSLRSTIRFCLTE